MKKTQLTDALRNVKKQKVSWFAVVVIAMLSSLAYLGINFASRGIANNGNEFYDATSFRDAEVISTLLLTPEDVDAIKALDGVEDAEGIYYTSGRAVSGETETGADFVSLTRRINVPLLLEGRLPSSADECAVERTVADDLGIALGDEIALTGEKGEKAEYIKGRNFKVTGIVYHPDHASVPASVPGNRDVVLLPEAFDVSSVDGCFMKAVALFKGTEGLDRFSDEYEKISSSVLKEIEELASVREGLRSDGIKERYVSAIDEAEKELAKGREKLDAARAELDRGAKELADGKEKYESSGKELEDGAKELAEAEKRLADAKKELDANKALLDSYEKQLAEGLEKLKAGEVEYEASGKKLKDAEKELESGKAELDAGKAKLEEAQKKLESGKQELIDGYSEFCESVNSTFRSVLTMLSEQLGEYAEELDFKLLDSEVDPDDPDATLTVAKIGDNVVIDLNKSLDQNIFDAITSLGVPDDVLRAAIERLGGTVSALADRVEVIREFTNTVKLYYMITDFMYESVASGAKKWDAGHAEYLAGLEEYNAGVGDYEAGVEKYNAGLAEYEAGQKDYSEARATLDLAWKEYNEKKAEFDAGVQKLTEGTLEYAKGVSDYENGKAEYESGKAEYEAGAKELEDAEAKLEQGEKEYENGLKEYNEGEERANEAKKELEDVGNCHWVVLGTRGNAGFISMLNSIGNVADMGVTFALVFVLVGAIMIYATSGRIVEEQRRLVGATKALGLFTREIFVKYAIFGVTATAAGLLLGVGLGYFGLQRILLFIYGRYYVFGPGKSAFEIGMTLAVFFAGILLSTFAVWIACAKLLRSTATSLMQDKTPPVKRKKAGADSSGKSLYSRLIVRNMLSDKTRLVVTVVSIAGCCALLTAGFTMRSSVMKALDRQFEEITRYDIQINFTPDEDGKTYSEIASLLDGRGAEWTPIHTSNTTSSSEGRLMAVTLLSGDLAKLDRFYSRIDTSSGDTITQSGDGVWINQRVSEMYGIKPGDTITLYNEKMDPFDAVVAGVFRIYAGKDMVLSGETYEKLFGKKAEYNSVVAFYGKADASLLDEARKIDGVEEVVDMEETHEWFMEQAAVMNLLSVIMIVIAGLMAYFILLNLTSMYIQQKKRELTIMRINGFTVREVIGYVLREMIVTTVIGIAGGLFAGSLLGNTVVGLMESATVGFIHGVHIDAWIFATLITVVYSLSINYFVLRKVRYLKLTDVA